jgi:SAM-dependent methyltransferase
LEVTKPQNIQDSLYEFPLHHLGSVEPGKIWRVTRVLFWGYDHLALLETVCNLVIRYRPERLVDFGCDDGRLIKDLISNDQELLVTGFDTSEWALAFANAFCFGNERVRLHQSLAHIDPPFLPVDAIIAMEVLEHIPPAELTKVIVQLRSVLDARGILIVTVPTTNIPLTPKHYQHFTLETFLPYVGEWFELLEHLYVHRVGWAWDVFRRMVVNRFFVADFNLWLRLTTTLYRRFITNATPKTGAHLVAVLRMTTSSTRMD